MTLRLGARLWWGLLLLVVLAWALGLLVAPTIAGLPSAPWIAGPGVLIGRFVRDASSALTVGSLVVGALMVDSSRARGWAVRWAAIWLVTVAVLGVLTFAEVYALSPMESAGGLWSYFAGTAVGRVFAVQVLLIVAVLAASPWWRHRSVAWSVTVLAMAAAMGPSFLGHGGLTGGHASATISLALHLGGFALWVGGLAACLALLLIDPTVGPVLMPRFSVLALCCVIVVAETGLVNASLRVGTPDLFVGSLYGSVVLCKALLLGWLIRLGWLQRRRALPLVSTGPSAILRFGGREVLIMGVALGISVLLTRIGPPTGVSTSGAFAPLAVLVLALGLPLLLAWMLPTPSFLRSLTAWPEIPSVALLVSIALIAGLRAPTILLGVPVGVLVGSFVLVLVGWATVCAMRAERGVIAMTILLVGWPVVAVLNGSLAPGGGGWPLVGIQVVMAEALIAAVLIGRRRRRPSASTTPANDSSTVSPSHVG